MTGTKQKTKQANKKVASIVTGEIIESKDSAIENIGIIDSQIDALKNNKRQIKKSQGLENKQVRQNTNYFYRLYKTDWELLKGLSNSAFKVLKFFEMNMDYMSNSIIIDNKHATYKDMSVACDIGYRQFERAVKELKDINIIKVIRKGKYNVIVMNPMYIEDSKTDIDVYNLFK